MAGSKVTPEAIERAREAFRRHYMATGAHMTYEELRAALGGVGSNTFVKELRDELIKECEATDEVERFLAPDTLKRFVAALGGVHREMRHSASLELTDFKKKADEKAKADAAEIKSSLARLDALETQHAELRERHDTLLKTHAALEAREREQHAEHAASQAENRLLTKQVADQKRTLDRLLPRGAAPAKPAPEAGRGKTGPGGAKGARTVRAKAG